MEILNRFPLFFIFFLLNSPGCPEHPPVRPRRGMPLGRVDHRKRGAHRALGTPAVVPGQQLPVGALHVRRSGRRRASGGVAVGEGERVPVVLMDVSDCREGGADGGECGVEQSI